MERCKNHPVSTEVENLNDDTILCHMFTHHDTANIIGHLPPNARFSQRLLINLPYCQTIHHHSVLESKGTLGAFNLPKSGPSGIENNSIWAGEMTPNDELDFPPPARPAQVPMHVKYGLGHK